MSLSGTTEEHVEAYLVKRVKALGGFSLKTDRIRGFRFLDRTCFLPGGVTLVIETKRPKNGRRSAHQVEHVERLTAMGHKVYWAHTTEAIDAILTAEGFSDAS